MADKKINYEALSSELDDIIEKLQNVDIPVDQAMKLYERGVGITTKLENYLKTAENTINKVTANTKD